MKTSMTNKPFKSMNSKVFTQTAGQLRAEVHQEINSRRAFPIVIERSSKEDIKREKKLWQKNPVRDNEVMLTLTKAVERKIRFNVRFNAL